MMNKVFVQTTEILNLINQPIRFLVVGATFRIRDLRPGRSRQVKLWKVMQWYRKNAWDSSAKLKVCILIQNQLSGLEITGSQLLYFTRIVVKWERVGEDDPPRHLPRLEAIREHGNIDQLLRLQLLKFMRNKCWKGRPWEKIGPPADEIWARTSPPMAENSTQVGVLEVPKLGSEDQVWPAVEKLRGDEEDQDELVIAKQEEELKLKASGLLQLQVKAIRSKEDGIPIVKEEEEPTKAASDAVRRSCSSITDHDEEGSRKSEDSEIIPLPQQSTVGKRSRKGRMALAPAAPLVNPSKRRGPQRSRSFNLRRRKTVLIRSRGEMGSGMPMNLAEIHDNVEEICRSPRVSEAEVNADCLVFGFLFFSILLATKAVDLHRFYGINV